MKRDQIGAAIDEAARRSTRVARRSHDHGPDHWIDVAHMGMEQIAAGVPADPDVLVTFAALHDTQRWSEWKDPHHGPRAVTVASAMRREGFLGYLDDDQYARLIVALQIHNGSNGHWDTTVGACLDADRYTLPRVKIRTDPNRLSCWKQGHIDRRMVRSLIHYGYQLTTIGPVHTWDEVLDQWGEVAA